MDANIKLEIKDAIWELKNARKIITVKNVYDQANGKIDFNHLPEIKQYLESVKNKFLFTYCNGYLELKPFDNVSVKDLISRA